MRIYIATSGIPFSGDSLLKSSLGGSETAVLSIAKSLADLGHSVRVFCNATSEGTFDGVEYADLSTFREYVRLYPCDVLIASRFSSYLMYPSEASLRVLWLHDMCVLPEKLAPHLFQTDLVFGLSQFHIEDYCSKLPGMRPLFVQTKNGVDLQLVDECRSQCNKIPKKLIYTSRPERGLFTLLTSVMPRILEEIPDCQLHVATYDLPKHLTHGSAWEIYELCENAMESLGDRVVRLGHLPKAQLYREIASSELMLYPCCFPEISCISAIESMACGTPIVTTDDFALPETVSRKAGVLIPGDPLSPEYAERFANQAIRLLKDDELRQKLSASGPKYVKDAGMEWSQIADQWLRIFEETFRGRSQAKIVKSLCVRGDFKTAHSIDPTVQLPQSLDVPEVPIDVWKEAKRLAFAIGNPIDEICLVSHDGLPFKDKSLPHGVSLTFRSSVQNPNCVVSVGEMETAESPCSYVDEMRRRLSVSLAGGYGTIVTATRWNFPDSGRLWNLDAQDLSGMFLDCPKFQSSFVRTNHESDCLSGWWICAASVGYATPIRSVEILEKVRRTRPYQTLATCLITKDEEEWIRGAINSVLNISDQIIVTDTGSTDSTKRIVESYRDSVELREVEFSDFSQARNQSIRCDADWVLVIDADERLTNPWKIRKYIDSTFFNAYQISQVHLMADVERSRDFPVRLFRNVSNHKYVGLIHEQLMDVSSDPLGAPVQPSYLIDDCELLHYGYSTERVRVTKCRTRNLELLIKEVQTMPNRNLTWFNVIRDYMNMVRWAMQNDGPEVVPRSVTHVLLSSIVHVYRGRIAGSNKVYQELAEPFVQDALKILGVNRLPVLGFSGYPVEIGLSLAASFVGLADKNIAMRTSWHVNMEEATRYLEEQIAKLKIVTPDPLEVRCDPDESFVVPSPEKLLRLGVEGCHERNC